jgi:hypothetical protein
VISKSGLELADGFVVEFESPTMRIKTNNPHNAYIMQELTLFVYNQVKGECVYTASVDSIEEKKLNLKNVKFVRSVQKRDNTRVSKIMKYRITHRFEGEGTAKLERPIDITILNISAQGMYISCLDKFIVGHRFPLVFRDAGRPINLNVEIVRCEDYNRSYNYGCRFVGISQKDMDNIFRFVLHEQIEQRRSNLLI